MLGAILFGLATSSEAAVIGAFGALILAGAYRSFTFSAVFTLQGGDQIIKDFVIALNLSPFMFMIVAHVIIFVLGWPLEWAKIFVTFVPIFLPLLDYFGIDPLFFSS